MTEISKRTHVIKLKCNQCEGRMTYKTKDLGICVKCSGVVREYDFRKYRNREKELRFYAENRERIIERVKAYNKNKKEERIEREGIKIKKKPGPKPKILLPAIESDNN